MKPLVLVAGALANKPHNGGAAWTRLSWIEGLAELGFEVFFLEEIGPAACRDRAGRTVGIEDSVNLAYFRKVTGDFGIEKSAALLSSSGEVVFGATFAELLDRAESASCLVNITGHLRQPALMRRIARKIYLDLDPGYTQCWQMQGVDLGLENHHLHFTVGENLGTRRSPLPTCGIRWIPTRQPVVLARWPVTPCPGPPRFTTVGSWRGAYGPIDCENRHYGAKVHEFRRFWDIPERVKGQFELAMQIDAEDGRDLEQLTARGWRWLDPIRELPEPQAFRRYVQGSFAEFSTAQGIYVHGRSGWFSDRSVRYLASGKPVIVQDTGLASLYPDGEGILTFRNQEDAVRSAREVLENYSHQSRRAREVAETYFDSRKVLTLFAEKADL